MKKLIASFALAGVVSSASAFTEDISITGSFDFESEYIFRGIDLAPQSFQPSVEFGTSVLGGDAYFGIWTSQTINNSQAFTEIDFYTGFAYAIDDTLTADVGFTYYYFPDNGAGVNIDRTREIYLGFAADVLLSPAVYFYYDFDLEQITIEGAIGYSVDLGELAGAEGASLDLGAYLGFLDSDDINAGQTAAAVENGYTYYGITADVVYALSDNVTSSVGLRWSGNNDVDDNDSNLWIGSTLAFAY